MSPRASRELQIPLIPGVVPPSAKGLPCRLNHRQRVSRPRTSWPPRRCRHERLRIAAVAAGSFGLSFFGGVAHGQPAREALINMSNMLELADFAIAATMLLSVAAGMWLLVLTLRDRDVAGERPGHLSADRDRRLSWFKTWAMTAVAIVGGLVTWKTIDVRELSRKDQAMRIEACDHRANVRLQLLRMYTQLKMEDLARRLHIVQLLGALNQEEGNPAGDCGDGASRFLSVVVGMEQELDEQYVSLKQGQTEKARSVQIAAAAKAKRAADELERFQSEQLTSKGRRSTVQQKKAVERLGTLSESFRMAEHARQIAVSQLSAAQAHAKSATFDKPAEIRMELVKIVATACDDGPLGGQCDWEFEISLDGQPLGVREGLVGAAGDSWPNAEQELNWSETFELDGTGFILPLLVERDRANVDPARCEGERLFVSKLQKNKAKKIEFSCKGQGSAWTIVASFTMI